MMLAKQQKSPYRPPTIDVDLANKEYDLSIMEKSDLAAEEAAKDIVQKLARIGEKCKDLTSYSYPPMLYIRGEDDSYGE
jgi:hypothetical protein